MIKRFLAVLALTLSLVAGGTSAYAMSKQWATGHNDSGLSEVAVEVVHVLPLDKYDMVIFTVNPVVTITGSGCTITGGTTSFATVDDTAWYINGGVTFLPSSLKLNSIDAVWQVHGLNYETEGTSGESGYYRYQFETKGGSGNTNWVVKVMHSGASLYWREITEESGGSMFTGGLYFPRHSSTSLASGGTVTSSTTFTPAVPIGWVHSVTPYFVAIGEK